MRVLCIAVLVTALVIATAAKQRARKFDGDFEFAEEVSICAAGAQRARAQPRLGSAGLGSARLDSS
jgi:hypothetical protein